MPQWEYLVIFIEDSKVAQDQPAVDVYMDVDKYSQALNRYGDAGWELVSFEGRPEGARAAFKRLKQLEPVAKTIYTPSTEGPEDEVKPGAK
jgi:hypothetical protein